MVEENFEISPSKSLQIGYISLLSDKLYFTMVEEKFVI